MSLLKFPRSFSIQKGIHVPLNKTFNYPRMYHIELKNDKLFRLIDNLEKRSHEKPIWAASKRLLHNTFLLRKDEETIANNQLPSRWIKDTNEWSIDFANFLGIRVKECNLIEELFPNKIPDFSKLIKDIIEKVPSANNPDDYVSLYRKDAQKLNSEEILVAGFARRLYDLCKNLARDEKETFVDLMEGNRNSLFHILLQIELL